MGFLFGSRPRATQPAPMPVKDDVDARAAAERQKQAMLQRSGRSSTILSRGVSGGGEAGTRAYANTLLGSAG